MAKESKKFKGSRVQGFKGSRVQRKLAVGSWQQKVKSWLLAKESKKFKSSRVSGFWWLSVLRHYLDK
ncbi:MAG: hypothetical protein IPH20_20560 [Bacteroidales bacterium]|nr:hypothetical protein [Bacteroidales bacterium]